MKAASGQRSTRRRPGEHPHYSTIAAARAALQAVRPSIEQQAQAFAGVPSPSIATRGTLNPQRGFSLLRSSIGGVQPSRQVGGERR